METTHYPQTPDPTNHRDTLTGIKSIYNYLKSAVNRPVITAHDRAQFLEADTAFKIFCLHLKDELTAMGLDGGKGE